MTLRNNRAPLLSNIKLYASFHHHMWIQTGFAVRKWLNWILTSVILTFDLWPWPFARTSRLSLVTTPENFMMIRWWEHSIKVWRTDWRTDGRTDRQTDRSVLRAAWSQLKYIKKNNFISGPYDMSSHDSIRDYFIYAPSQWETTLQCSVVSHWLGSCTKSFLL